MPMYTYEKATYTHCVVVSSYHGCRFCELGRQSATSRSAVVAYADYAS